MLCDFLKKRRMKKKREKMRKKAKVEVKEEYPAMPVKPDIKAFFVSLRIES